MFANCFYLSILIEAVVWMWWREVYSSRTLEAVRGSEWVKLDGCIKMMAWRERKGNDKRESIITDQVNGMAKRMKCQWVFSSV